MIEYYLELPENSKKLVATRNEHEKTSRMQSHLARQDETNLWKHSKGEMRSDRKK